MSASSQAQTLAPVTRRLVSRDRLAPGWRCLAPRCGPGENHAADGGSFVSAVQRSDRTRTRRQSRTRTNRTASTQRNKSIPASSKRNGRAPTRIGGELFTYVSRGMVMFVRDPVAGSQKVAGRSRAGYVACRTYTFRTFNLYPKLESLLGTHACHRRTYANRAVKDNGIRCQACASIFIEAGIGPPDWPLTSIFQ